MQKSKSQIKSQKVLFARNLAIATWSREHISAIYRLAPLARKIIVFLFFLLWIFVTPRVSAHVLKVYGTIGVTIHIDPDDAPIAGQPSTIFAVIKDTSGKFDEKNPGECDCTLSISQNGKELAKLPIVVNNTYNTMQYVFPRSGTYTLVVDGKPKKQGIFQPFRLSFEYFAAGNDNSSAFLDRTNQLSVYSPYIVLLIGILILFMFLNPFPKR